MSRDQAFNRLIYASNGKLKIETGERDLTLNFQHFSMFSLLDLHVRANTLTVNPEHSSTDKAV